ncbi:uncharacterized protein [Typha angustifolia]|uniref:uncharacterized protein n=1 Tax=Typha angustifolia TaxID=59011 RepID=UPI003C2CB6A8
MSLAITERKPQQQRPSGCVGILFQLLDWNRRLTKKKLFSKTTLLPPVRAAKRVSKKLGSDDDKMPIGKLLLIAEENRGGFPSARKPVEDAGDGMRAPGLVARLMGLETMPVEKPRRALDSTSSFASSSGGSTSSDGYRRVDQDLCLQNGSFGKAELPRPQKLQKTGGFLESRPACGMDRNVLSPRLRRQQNRLSSPVKSPRFLSGSCHRARLAQVASKILEPGMRPRSQAKCALTYIGSSQCDQEFLGDPLVGSCKSCGSLVEVAQLRVGVKEPWLPEHRYSAPDFSNSSSKHDGSLETKLEPMLIPGEHERVLAHPVHDKVNVERRASDLVERNCDIMNVQDQCKVVQNAASKSFIKVDKLRQNEKLVVKGKEACGSNKVASRTMARRVSNDLVGSRDIGASNRNPRSRTKMRSGATGDRTESERNGLDKSMTRKRRPPSSTQIEGGVISSDFVKRSIGSNMINQKGKGSISNPLIHNACVRRDLRKKDNNRTVSSRKENSKVSFSASSPMKQITKSSTYNQMAQKSSAEHELPCIASNTRRSVLDAESGSGPSSSERIMTLTGDSLSKLLEQKIRELNFLDRDELATSDALSGRSTASILEGLVSAFTKEAPLTPMTQKSVDSCSGLSTPTSCTSHGSRDLSESTVLPDQTPDILKNYQGDANTGNSAAYLNYDSSQPSPISVLEASFSNDSCSLGSSNDNVVMRGGKPLFGLMNSSGNAEPQDLDSDLLDSATSINAANSNIGTKVHSIKKKLSLCCIDSLDCGLSEARISSAAETILNAQLLCGNISFWESDGALKFSLHSFLLDMLGALVNVFCTSSKGNSGFTLDQEGHQLQELLFDCIIECLDSKYLHICKSGYNKWSKLPLLNKDRLAEEIFEKISDWKEMAGKFLDNLVQKEFVHSNVQWSKCETEAFEMGMEIESNILQALVDEFVFELC